MDNGKALGIVGTPHSRQAALCHSLRERPNLIVSTVPGHERHRVDVTFEKAGNG